MSEVHAWRHNKTQNAQWLEHSQLIRSGHASGELAVMKAPMESKEVKVIM